MNKEEFKKCKTCGSECYDVKDGECCMCSSRIAICALCCHKRLGATDINVETSDGVKVWKSISFELIFVPCKEFHKLIDTVTDKFYNSGIRGFVDLKNSEIYVCEKHWDLTLISHELGHVLGYKHTIFPTTMNPSGAFRWFCNPFKSLWKTIGHWWNR